MRPDYIKLIRDYITGREDYWEVLKELRSTIRTMGGTEEEFDEAVKELGVVPLDSKEVASRFGKARKYVSIGYQKFIAFNYATHFVALILFSVILVLFSSYYFMQTITTQRHQEQKNQLDKQLSLATSEKKDERDDNSLIPPVYANTQEIDPKRVFSFPASNVSLAISGTPKKEVYGFFPYWMLASEDQVSLNALTGVGLFALETDGKGNIITKLGDGEDDPGWKMWNDSKLPDFITRVKKRKIKFELVIKAFNNDNIEQLVQNDASQKTFIANALYLIQSKGLKGINLDFEYVGTPTSKVTDGFTRLITNLRTEMKRQIPDSTLTIDTYLTSAAVPRLFDLQLLESQVDAFVIMGYDVHTPKGEAGPIAPMEGELSVLGLVQSYLEKVQSEKLILAVPYYGYDWPVPNTSGDVRTIPFAELADISRKQTILWDDTAQTPYYRYKDGNVTREVHFENTRSLGVKYDFVNRKNLRGIGIWALGYDGLNGDLRSLIIEKFAN